LAIAALCSAVAATDPKLDASKDPMNLLPPFEKRHHLGGGPMAHVGHETSLNDDANCALCHRGGLHYKRDVDETNMAAIDANEVNSEIDAEDINGTGRRELYRPIPVVIGLDTVMDTVMVMVMGTTIIITIITTILTGTLTTITTTMAIIMAGE
ncbi:hypothetical protein BG004_003548, partial [Podila humilis]